MQAFVHSMGLGKTLTVDVTPTNTLLVHHRSSSSPDAIPHNPAEHSRLSIISFTGLGVLQGTDPSLLTGQGMRVTA